jgi:magnesium-transporting ATPase (P-type)
MSVVVKDEDNQIFLMCKGADRLAALILLEQFVSIKDLFASCLTN